MKIMLCGAKSRFAECVMARLGKEGHEVYRLTGSTCEDRVDAPVFQEFRLDYMSGRVASAFASALPDVAVVMGAFDAAFAWTEPEKDAVAYPASLVNLLSAAKAGGVRRIVYLSTVNVFENNDEPLISRDTVPRPTSAANEAFARAERLCACFRDERTEVVVVRLPEVFGAHDDRLAGNVCLLRARGYLEQGKAVYVAGQSHCALYHEDAADIVFRIAVGRSQDVGPVMQFLGYRFTEDQLADVLMKGGWNPAATAVREDAVAAPFAIGNIVDTQEAQIGAYLKYGFAEAVGLLCRDCLRARAERVTVRQRVVRLLPFVESVALCLAAYGAQAVSGGTWIGEHINFFILYTLVLGVSYGTAHGLLAALLSGVASLVLATAHATLVDVLGDFGFFVSLLQLILVGVIAGFLKDKYQRKNSTLTEENAFIANELSDVTLVNESNLYVKNLFEKRLVESHSSLSRIYELTVQLDHQQSQRVVFRAVDVVKDVLEVDDVAIYVASRNPAFFRLAASSDLRARACGKSLAFDEACFLYEAVSAGEVYRNDALEPNLPTFACAVPGEERPVALILVWAKTIDQVNLYESDLLALLCRLVAKAMARAVAYEEAVAQSSYIEGTRFLREEAFLELLALYQDGRRRGLLPFALLRLEVGAADLAAAGGYVRDTDVLGTVGGAYYAILSNAEPDEVGFAVRRIADKGVAVAEVDDRELLPEDGAPAGGGRSHAA